MADGRDKRTRQHNAALSALVWGEIKDVKSYVERGVVDGKERVGQTAPMSPDVALYVEAIKKAGGRFVMPDEAERILKDGTPLPPT